MKVRTLFVLVALMSVTLSAQQGPNKMSVTPAARPGPYIPDAKQVNQVDDFFGTKIADPYRWLEDSDAPDTRAWIDAENKVTFAYLEQIPERPRIKSSPDPTLELRALRCAVARGPLVHLQPQHRPSEAGGDLQDEVPGCRDRGARSTRTRGRPTARSPSPGCRSPRMAATWRTRRPCPARIGRSGTSRTSPPRRICRTSSSGRSSAAPPGSRTAQASTTAATTRRRTAICCRR